MIQRLRDDRQAQPVPGLHEPRAVVRDHEVEDFRSAIHPGARSGAIQRVKHHRNLKPKELIMLSWAITFLVIALIAAVLGFGGIAGTAVGIAKIIFVVFLILFVISFVMGRRAPRG